MPPAPDTSSRKVHASLNVENLANSISFYQTLFGAAPAKLLSDYAKFEIDDPPLVLSLVPTGTCSGGNLNHLGLRLRTFDELVAFQSRLEATGISTNREDGVECCHSSQTKFWVTDPDCAVWEIYILHGDNDEYDSTPAPAAAQSESFAKSVGREKTSWRHQLGEPFPSSIPYPTNSVHEVELEGTANIAPEAFPLSSKLTEVMRVLRPGGFVHLHGLAADEDLRKAPISLSGPASIVQYVPSTGELAGQFQSAGFAEIQFDKLSDRARFRVSEIGLREFVLSASKPGFRPQARKHAAVYLGPFLRVEDGYGNSFPRGVRVLLNVHDWRALKLGQHASQFLLLEPFPS